MSYHQIVFFQFIILSFLISFSIELRNLRIIEEEEQNDEWLYNSVHYSIKKGIIQLILVIQEYPKML